MKLNLLKPIAVFMIIFTSSFVLLFPSSTKAISGTLRQQILPLNCVFQTINVGTGLLYYVTPEECGVIVPPNPAQPNPDITQGTTPPAQQNEQLPAPFRILSPYNISTQNRITTGYTYPWQPLANAGSAIIQEAKQSDSPPNSPPVAGILAVAAILLIIIIIIL